jgi:hypothetical protein
MAIQQDPNAQAIPDQPPNSTATDWKRLKTIVELTNS